jgi:hypothetical protein
VSIDAAGPQAGTRSFQPALGVVAAPAPFEDHTRIRHGRALLLTRPDIQGELHPGQGVTGTSDGPGSDTERIAADPCAMIAMFRAVVIGARPAARHARLRYWM